MSWELFKTTLRRNWMLWAIFLGVLTMYASIMIVMYNPENMAGLTAMLGFLPPEMLSAFGLGAFTNLTEFLGSWFYGLLAVAFPMVYCVLLGNRLVVKMVDDGSFAYLLSTPNTRTKIIVTQGVYALASVALLLAIVCGICVATCEASFPGMLNIPAFLRLNLTTTLLNMAVMMIVFFASCLFNETGHASMLGAGLPIVFLLMKMLGGTSPDLKALVDTSMYGWYSPVQVAGGASSVGVNLIYAGICLVLFMAGTVIFRRKRLPL